MKKILFIALALGLLLCGCKKAESSTTLEDLQTIGKMVQVDGKLSVDKALNVLEAQHSQFNYGELTVLLATHGVTLPALPGNDDAQSITVTKRQVAIVFCAACVTYGFLFM